VSFLSAEKGEASLSERELGKRSALEHSVDVSNHNAKIFWKNFVSPFFPSS
jgi:hypothetical protein